MRNATKKPLLYRGVMFVSFLAAFIIGGFFFFMHSHLPGGGHQRSAGKSDVLSITSTGDGQQTMDVDDTQDDQDEGSVLTYAGCVILGFAGFMMCPAVMERIARLRERIRIARTSWPVALPRGPSAWAFPTKSPFLQAPHAMWGFSLSAKNTRIRERVLFTAANPREFAAVNSSFF